MITGKTASRLPPTSLAGGDVVRLRLLYQRMTEVAQRAARVLGEAFLARRAIADALALVRTLQSLDPCDETACLLAMRAHLRAGAASNARHEYLDYRNRVARELAGEPSPELQRLYRESVLNAGLKADALQR